MAQTMFGGFDPALVQQAINLEQQKGLLEQAKLDPAAYLRYSAGLRGQMAGQSVGELFGIANQDPRLKMARDAQEAYNEALSLAEGDASSASFFKAFANAAAKRNIPDLARQAATQAATLESEAAQGFQRQAAGIASLASAARERTVTPQNKAEQDYLDSLYAKYPDTIAGRAQAANEFSEWKSSFKQREAAAAIPSSGEVKIQDLAAAQNLVKDLTGGSKDKLDTVRTTKTFLAQAKRGEGAALPQLKRQLVKLVGDSQIGQGEVRDALGSAGIVGDTINAVNQFMTGVPTLDKLNSVEQVINALEEINARSYNAGRTRAEQIIGEARFSENTKKTLIPPAYRTGREKTTALLTGQDKQAYDWAKANPNDPRSTAILNKLGVQ